MSRIRWSAILLAAAALLSVLTARPAVTESLASPAQGAPARSLSAAERATCAYAVESVYYAARVAPEGASAPKAPLDQLLTAEMVAARVDDTLRASNALADRWNAPVTGAMLQAEMERMAAETRQPEQLRALFAALDNDPALVAECLARPALAERLLRDWFASDTRLHGEVAARAAAALDGVTSPDTLKTLGADYEETTWELGDPASAATGESFRLDGGEWEDAQTRLAGWLSAAPDALPVGTVSALQEDERAFFAVAILEASETRMVVATARWEKLPFERWWAAERARFPATVATPTVTYRLPAIGGDAMGGTNSWLPTPSIPNRTNVSAVWTGSEMITFGGGSPGTGRSNEGWRYNPATDTWLTISAVNAPTERMWHTAVWTGSEMIVWGGCGPTAQLIFCELNDGARYNPATGIWTAISTAGAPSSRVSHTAVWTGTEMIVWGGCNYTSSGSCPRLNTGGRYNPQTDSWVATSLAGAPTARTGHTAIWGAGMMIVWGGEDGVNRTNTGGRYNPATDTWTATSLTNAPSPRMGHTAIWTGNEMIVWGGCPDGAGCIIQGTPLNTGGRYNPATDSWIATNTAGAPSPRTGHTAVWTGSEMIVWGGGTSNNIFYNTGGRYNAATNTWLPTSTMNAPAPRYGHVALWTGERMIVWGGGHRTGGRYHAATDSWTPTSTEDPNSIRSEHRAVWTGAEMLVWGGEDINSGATSSGRIYNPATRTWRTMPGVSLGGRHAFTALWTGSEMIVWGGQEGNWVYDDGARFNPTTNGWLLIPATAAPEARSYHVGVWTGSEMIVWGGSGENGMLNTGGRYNVATNTWSPITTAGAPEARYLLDGVWTGSEMIVWGGASYNVSEMNTGGRYNPVTNTWQPTSMTNAPEGRRFHQAIWTGSEMIVWGGAAGNYDNPTNPQQGGRYNPASNTWQPTSTVNAPSGRLRHSQIWTGSEMIVWGGCSGSYCSNPYDAPVYTGGHYNPATDSWTPTVIDGGVPRARGEHSTVWTGDRMIVWGGYTDMSGYTNTGAEYLVPDAPPMTPTPTPPPVTPSPTAPPVTPTATALPPTATVPPAGGQRLFLPLILR